MDRRIDAHVARTQFAQIMDRVVEHNEHFVVERRGEPAVVIMSVRDFIRTAAQPPDWLEKAWRGAKRRGASTSSPQQTLMRRSQLTAVRKRVPIVPRQSDPRGRRYQRLYIGAHLTYG